MTFPLNFDMSPLAAILVIKDIDDVEQFRYEMPQVVIGTPVQDFQLVGGNLIRGINTEHGSLTFLIRDDDELLTVLFKLLYERIFTKYCFPLTKFKSFNVISLKYRSNLMPVPAKGIISIGQFGIGIINISQFGVGLISISQFTIALYAKF